MNDTLKHHVETLWPVEGSLWLESMPSLLEELKSKWQLEFAEPYQNLSYHYVLKARHRKFGPCVLKCGPCLEVVAREVAALKQFKGNACVELLAEDLSLGAILLSRLEPGEVLPVDELEVFTTSDLMRSLWVPNPDDAALFKTIAEELRSLDCQTELPQTLTPFVEEARRIRAYLFKTSSERYLLHGDLHHWNILSDGDTYRIIDPKGVVGERGYEVAAFVLNPPGIGTTPDYAAKVQRRLAQFSESLSFDLGRLLQWTFVKAVVASVWAFEDHGEIPLEMSHKVIALHQLLDMNQTIII